MFSSLYTTVLNGILESLTDVLQNPVSIVIFSILTLLIVALIFASIFPSWRQGLVAIKILEKDERPSSLLIWILAIILVVKCVQGFIIQPFIVDGGSMLPTYHNKEFLLVDKFSYLVSKPHRGDVMIFKLYEGGQNPYIGKHLIKRVIGLPGERIVIQDGITTIYNRENPKGFTLDESFIIYKEPKKNVDITLDESHYFVMGDNRSQSYDSRDWGPLDEKNIKGQVLLRLYPLSKLSYEPGQHIYDK
jgi:signal peptidase I